MSEPDSIEERIRLAWPNAGANDVLQVGPLGSRGQHNILLYNRRTGRVATGVNYTPVKRPCFEGSLEEFEDAVNETYKKRVNGEPVGGILQEKYLRLWDEYRMVVQFLKDLPKLD